MMCLHLNKTEVWYALHTDSSEVSDDGIYTGEWAESYSDPVNIRINVTEGGGRARIKETGIDTEYTHVLTTSDLDCPIREDSVLWIGRTPNEANDNYNYMVIRGGVRRSMNFVRFLVREVRNRE